MYLYKNILKKIKNIFLKNQIPNSNLLASQLRLLLHAPPNMFYRFFYHFMML